MGCWDENLKFCKNYSLDCAYRDMLLASEGRRFTKSSCKLVSEELNLLNTTRLWQIAILFVLGRILLRVLDVFSLYLVLYNYC